MIFHEFFHIQNGHCDYKKNLDELEPCNDFSKMSIKDFMIHQTLEYDADLCAIASFVNEEVRSYRMRENCLGFKIKPPVNDMSIFLIKTIISLYILYNIFYRMENTDLIDSKFLEKRIHPIPGLRLNYILLNAFCALSNTGFFNQNDINYILEKTLDSLDIFIKSFSEKTDSKFLKVISNEIANKHIQKVHDNWEYVRSLLSTKYVTLAPYNKFDYSIYLKKE